MINIFAASIFATIAFILLFFLAKKQTLIYIIIIFIL